MLILATTYNFVHKGLWLMVLFIMMPLDYDFSHNGSNDHTTMMLLASGLNLFFSSYSFTSREFLIDSLISLAHSNNLNAST
jgi:hypothetical protein